MLPGLTRLVPLTMVAVLAACGPLRADDAPVTWLAGTAFALPKETTNQGSGYFSIVEGPEGKLYIGTARYGVSAYLVQFDPASAAMRVVLDAQHEIGQPASGFAAQSKFHTRNNVGASGRVYVGTKQGYPAEGESRQDYPGGYPMVYDPRTDSTRVYPIPIAHQGIISIMPDESRGVAYISTCSDERPIESTHFMRLDLETGHYRDLLDCRHMYAFIVVDYLGRAYHPILGGRIARYDPDRDRLDQLDQTIDGRPPTAESLLAHPESHPINWDMSADRKTLYAVAMSGNRLYSYDLTQSGDTLAGRDLGPLLPGGVATDCRAMCTGPRGEVWAAVWGKPAQGEGYLHLVSYAPGNDAPRDRGAIAVVNPGYTEFADAAGAALPWHHGFRTLADGRLAPLYHMGICRSRAGKTYVTVICPYTIIELDVED